GWRAPVWELLRNGSATSGARRDVQFAGPGSFAPPPADPLGGLGGGFGGLGGGFGGPWTNSRFALLLDPCNLEWLECAHTFVSGPAPRTPAPPSIGRIEPTDIHAGQAAQI